MHALPSVTAERPQGWGNVLTRGVRTVAMQRIVPLMARRDSGWVEVLWRPSLAGIAVPPLTAIRILASEGRSTQIDRAMIDGVVNWRARNADAGVLAINVNPHVLVQPGFAGELLALLEGVCLDPRALILEVSELFPGPLASALGAPIKQLRDAGIRIALDDVGAGHCHLDIAIGAGVDIIKLDAGLLVAVRESADPAHAERALEGLVLFSHAIGAQVVAEGIESSADVALARRVGADYGQGFHLHVPRTVDLKSTQTHVTVA